VTLRRSLAAGTVALVAAAVLTACGFNYPTDRISNLTVGTDYRDGNVSILNAVVVSSAGNGGTFVATFVNKTIEDQQLTGISGDGTKVTSVEATPLTIKPQGLVNLANDGGYAVIGTFAIGDFVHLTFTFGDNSSVGIDVPVVPATGDYAGLDTATPSASPSASPSAAPSDSSSAASSATASPSS
jgi:hypothetical protein